MIAATFNCFSIPFKVAYNPLSMQTIWFTILNACIDFSFGIDIILTFRTSFIDDYGNEIYLPKDIAKYYIQKDLWLDLAATLPLD